jgi:cell division septation protein DedD
VLLAQAEESVLTRASSLADASEQVVGLDRLAVPDSRHLAELVDAVARARAAVRARAVAPAAQAAVLARDAAAALRAEARAARAAGEARAALLASQERSTEGYANGAIPLDVLCEIPFARGEYLRCDAADALGRLDAAFRERFGRHLTVVDAYRTYAEQVAAKGSRGWLAAVPGTSNHGWALAVDLGGGVQRYGSPEYRWLQEHADEHGWHHPSYMDQGGRGPHEPWHWEFGTVDHPSTGTSPPIRTDDGTGDDDGPTPTPTPTTRPSATPRASATPTPTPSPTPTPTPTPSPRPTPSSTPSTSPTPTPSPTPTTTRPTPDGSTGPTTPGPSGAATGSAGPAASTGATGQAYDGTGRAAPSPTGTGTATG